MITIVKNVDTKIIDSLFSVYSESMDDMRSNFENEAEMRAAYTSFLCDFVSNPKQLVFVEEADGEWVSALRAIEITTGHWFFEAVETKPEARKKGFGVKLLQHTIAYLKSIGMSSVTCTIAKNNFKSQALHGKCGFKPTNDPPVNPWGELEEGSILYCANV